MNKTLMIVIAFLLLAVNWLTFHDLFEPHTLRDYLILAASILIFFHFAKIFIKNKQIS